MYCVPITSLFERNYIFIKNLLHFPNQLFSFQWIISSYIIHLLVNHLLNHLHIIDCPHIHLHTQLMCFSNPFRFLSQYLDIIINTINSFRLQSLGATSLFR